MLPCQLIAKGCTPARHWLSALELLRSTDDAGDSGDNNYSNYVGSRASGAEAGAGVSENDARIARGLAQLATRLDSMSY